MPSEVILPRVDMDMVTGKISKWLVAPGAAVTKGQPLFEIETDKATMEIEAEVAGTVRDLVAAGTTDIPVGSVVAWIDAANEAPPSTSGGLSASSASTIESDGAHLRQAASTEAVGALQSTGAAGPDRARATPLARRLARTAKIDLSTLQGSGPRGRVQASDVAAMLRPIGQRRAEVSQEAPASNGADRRSVLPIPTTAPDASSTLRGLKSLREGVGMPLLLVHGFGAEANSWRPFLQGVSLGRPIFGIELPGHGETTLGSIRSFDDLVDAVATTFPAAFGAFDVVAHSLGAAVAAALAARGDVPIRSLLLLAPAGLGPEINGGFLRGFLDATSEASLTPWMRELVADPAAITPAFIRSTLKTRDGTDRVSAQRRLAGVLFPDGTQAFSIRQDLSRIRAPIRVVHGAADAIIPAHHARALPPLAALHLLPGIGHMPQFEARDTVTTILRQMWPSE